MVSGITEGAGLQHSFLSRFGGAKLLLFSGMYGLDTAQALPRMRLRIIETGSGSKSSHNKPRIGP